MISRTLHFIFICSFYISVVQLAEPYVGKNQEENKGMKDYKKEMRHRKKFQWYSAEKKPTKQLLAGGIPSLTLVMWESLFFSYTNSSIKGDFKILY